VRLEAYDCPAPAVVNKSARRPQQGMVVCHCSAALDAVCQQTVTQRVLALFLSRRQLYDAIAAAPAGTVYTRPSSWKYTMKSCGTSWQGWTEAMVLPAPAQQGPHLAATAAPQSSAASTYGNALTAASLSQASSTAGTVASTSQLRRQICAGLKEVFLKGLQCAVRHRVGKRREDKPPLLLVLPAARICAHACVWHVA
jgi:hypothetical protein